MKTAGSFFIIFSAILLIASPSFAKLDKSFKRKYLRLSEAQQNFAVVTAISRYDWGDCFVSNVHPARLGFERAGARQNMDNSEFRKARRIGFELGRTGSCKDIFKVLYEWTDDDDFVERLDSGT